MENLKEIELYLREIDIGIYYPLSQNLFEDISDEGFVGELEDVYELSLTKEDFEYLILPITLEDKLGLINLDDATLEKFNELDINLKEIQTDIILLDFIDYDKGIVYIIRLKE